jgi:DNA-binding CsgD family transcriptional regulator
LGIETVRTHLKHIYEKLHGRSRAEAVARYMATRMPVAGP